MRKVLVINASARRERSLSRYLTQSFERYWQERYPEDEFLHREVGQAAIPHVDEAWIAAAFKPDELRTETDRKALALSDSLVAELKAADVIVVGSPMYNWSVPSALKAYIDQVLRVNETVLVSKENIRSPYTGLLNNKQVYLLMARGNHGYDVGDFYEHMDFQRKYLQTVFNIMGIQDVKSLALNGMGFQAESLSVADEKIWTLLNP